MPLKFVFKQSKPLLRWGILGLTLAFLGQSLRSHWQEVAAVSLTGPQAIALGVALLLTLIAHCWAGWVWGWILADLQQPRSPRWAMGTYLTTNLAKYLPGNIWHFYGRVAQTQQQQIPLVTGVTSVVLEALLMAAAALILALGSGAIGSGAIGPMTSSSPSTMPGGLLAIALVGVLIGIHPHWLNQVLQRLNRGKLRQWQRYLQADRPHPPAPSPPGRGGERILESLPLSSRERGWGEGRPEADSGEAAQGLGIYPWKPLCGEFIFLGLRGWGFLVILVALTDLTGHQSLRYLGGFSWAWLLGLVVPGAPGGLGVFEATALALFQNSGVAPGAILLSLGFYRLVSTIAELLGAAIGQLCLDP